MVEVETRKQLIAEAVAKYLAADQELLHTFQNFDISEFSYDQSPQSFYCGWVMSIMGTAFYNRWNAIRQKIAESAALPPHEDWATISAMAHELVTTEP